MKNEFKFHKRLISIIIALAVIAGLQTVIYASEAGIEILGVSAAGNGSNLDVTVRFNADSADKQVILVALPGDPGAISEDSLQNNAVWLKQFLPAKANPSDNFFTQSFSIDKPAVSPMNYTIYMSAKGASAKTYASVLFEEFVITYYDKDGKRISASVYSVNIPARESGTISLPITISKPDDAVNAGFMLWESVSSAKPLSAAISF